MARAGETHIMATQYSWAIRPVTTPGCSPGVLLCVLMQCWMQHCRGLYVAVWIKNADDGRGLSHAGPIQVVI